MAELVQLELDEKDKENFQELQNSMSEAQKEMHGIALKIRTKNAESKHAALTLVEMEPLPEDTKTYEQVGKMFLLKPLAKLRDEYVESVKASDAEVAALTEKKAHVEKVCCAAAPKATWLRASATSAPRLVARAPNFRLALRAGL